MKKKKGKEKKKHICKKLVSPKLSVIVMSD